jgi:shikimate kinase
MTTVRRGDSERPSIALIGLRGSGKSTVGRELASLLGGLCVDTDRLVVEAAGKSIARIFEEEGEAGFRRRECDAVTQVVATPPAVISVGGGAVLLEQNVRALRKVATIVWLTAPIEVLWERICADTTAADSRPPLTEHTGRAELKLLESQRSPIYQNAADLTVDTAQGSIQEVAHAIARGLGRSVAG